MDSLAVLSDAHGRIGPNVHAAVDGLTADQLAWRPDPEGNSIAWLVWHLTRVQDDHVAEVAGTEQVWTAQGWNKRFDLPFPDSAHGYGMSAADVAEVRVDDPALLTGYYDAVAEATSRYLATLAPNDLDRVVDDAWDPPVTLGVRLVSLIDDDAQHVGQAALLRGIVQRTPAP